jgi:hypothetical protein
MHGADIIRAWAEWQSAIGGGERVPQLANGVDSYTGFPPICKPLEQLFASNFTSLLRDRNRQSATRCCS